jgi:hypothetical protein
MNVLTDLEIAVARLPDVLSGAMLAGIHEPGVTIGAWAYESDLAMCPIAAAVRYAEKAGDTDTDWDPAWGTRDEYRLRVLDFVEAFDSYAELVGLDSAVRVLKNSLERTARARQAVFVSPFLAEPRAQDACGWAGSETP